MRLSKQLIVEVIIVSGLIVIALFLLNNFQKPISFNNGLGWDGADYYKAAEDIINNRTPEARGPFVFRIGTPLVVSLLFPDNPSYGFKIVNISASVLSLFALWIFLYLTVKSKILRLLLFISYLTYWQSPLRLTFFYPYHTDPLAVFFLFLALIFAYQFYKTKRNLFFYLLVCGTAIGVIFREIVLIPSIILLVLNLKISFNQSKFKVYLNNKFLIIPIVVGLFEIIIISLLVKSTNDYSFFNSAVGWIYRKSILMYIHSLFFAFGFLLVIPIYFYKSSLAFFKEEKFFSVMLVFGFVLSYAGGSDTERLAFWFAPAVFVLVARVIQSNIELIKNIFFIILIILLQLISNRAFFATPDYNDTLVSKFPFLTPIADSFPFFDMMAVHGNQRIILISAVQYFLMALILIFILFFIEKRVTKRL